MISTKKILIVYLTTVVSAIIILVSIYLFFDLQFNYLEKKTDLLNYLNYQTKEINNYLNSIEEESQYKTLLISNVFNEYKSNKITYKDFENEIKLILNNSTFIQKGKLQVACWFEPSLILADIHLGFLSEPLINDNKVININLIKSDLSKKEWYNSSIPFDWDRNLKLFTNVYWSDILSDTLISQYNFIALGLPIYSNNRIIGLFNAFIPFNFIEKTLSNREKYKLNIVFKKNNSNKTIFYNDTIISNFINNNKTYNLDLEEVNIDKNSYYIHKYKISKNYDLIYLIKSNYIYSLIINNLLLSLFFSISLIIVIFISIRYFNTKIINLASNNEKLVKYHRNILALIPNSIIIFNQDGTIYTYNKKFLDNFNFTDEFLKKVDLNYFVKKILEITEFNEYYNLNKLDKKEISLSKLSKYFVINFKEVEIDGQKSYIFSIDDITIIRKRELEIESLNRNLEVLIEKRTFQLEDAMKSLQDLNRKLSTHSMNLERLNIELFESQRKLKETLRLKDKFLSIIAHDIKNPIHSIKMTIELLKNYKNMMDAQEIDNYYQKLNDTLNSVIKLIENVLLWSKAQSQTFKFELESFNLLDFIQNEVKLFENNLNNKNINLIIDIDDKINVYTDKNILSLIIRNLINNAIKFSKNNSKIFINSKIDNEKVIFSIKDYGIGMDEETKMNVFNPLSKVSKKGTMGEEGTGLGLLLCNEFIKLLNEKIWINSKLNEFTEISFSIKLAD